MSMRLCFFAVAGIATIATMGCGGKSATPPVAPTAAPTFRPYAVTTSVPVPAGAAPFAVAIPTPFGRRQHPCRHDHVPGAGCPLSTEYHALDLRYDGARFGAT